jgi:hypothetical protein
MRKTEILNVFEKENSLFGIGKLDSYYYIVFKVCSSHIEEFKILKNFFCDIILIPENDAIIGTVFPEEIENIYMKYNEKKGKIYDRFSSLYANTKRITESTLNIFKKIDYNKWDIEFFLELSGRVFPFDLSYPEDTTKFIFITNENTMFPRAAKISDKWIIEFNEDEMNLIPLEEGEADEV